MTLDCLVVGKRSLQWQLWKYSLHFDFHCIWWDFATLIRLPDFCKLLSEPEWTNAKHVFQQIKRWIQSVYTLLSSKNISIQAGCYLYGCFQTQWFSTINHPFWSFPLIFGNFQTSWFRPFFRLPENCRSPKCYGTTATPRQSHECIYIYTHFF